MARTIAQTYPEIVEKARHLFWVHGYRSLSPEEIAEHLGVSKSTIYTKYTKDMLFVDSLESYIDNFSDPFLDQIKESEQGMETLREFFYMVVDALLNKTFPRSCLMVNTVVEMRNDQNDVSDLYTRYFGNMKRSYHIVLQRAYELGEIQNFGYLDKYADFLVGVLFGLSILYKVKSEKELKEYIDEHLALIK